MAFKALNIVLSRAYDEIKREAAKVHRLANSLRVASNGTITSEQILAFAGNLRSSRIIMQERSSISGIVDYAKSQESDQTYDISFEYSAMISQIDAVLLWISNNMPSANGYLQTNTLNQDGSISYREFETTITGGLRTALDALIASIE
jgi:hypothetical protein